MTTETKKQRCLSFLTRNAILGVFGKKVVVSIGCYRGVWFGPGKEFFQSLH